MEQDLTLFEAIYSQRGIRSFRTDPVELEKIVRILDAAVRAPNGSNLQKWRFLVIQDPVTRQAIAEYYLRAWEAIVSTGYNPSPSTSSAYLAYHLTDAPVLILACIENGGGPPTLGDGASIYPGVQNLCLAARALGLGTLLTLLHLRYDTEIKALLKIPDTVATAALIPLGYPGEGQHFGGARRRPLHEVTHWDRWGNQEIPTRG